MEIALLASMDFADRALSEYRGLNLASYLGFDLSRFDLFRHVLHLGNRIQCRCLLPSLFRCFSSAPRITSGRLRVSSPMNDNLPS